MDEVESQDFYDLNIYKIEAILSKLQESRKILRLNK